MPISQESMDIRKAMAYDLLQILKEGNGKSYTAEEVEQLIQAYIADLTKK